MAWTFWQRPATRVEKPQEKKQDIALVIRKKVEDFLKNHVVGQYKLIRSISQPDKGLIMLSYEVIMEGGAIDVNKLADHVFGKRYEKLVVPEIVGKPFMIRVTMSASLPRHQSSVVNACIIDITFRPKEIVKVVYKTPEKEEKEETEEFLPTPE